MASRHPDGGGSDLWIKLFQVVADTRASVKRTDRHLATMGRIIAKLGEQTKEKFADHEERLARLEARLQD